MQCEVCGRKIIGKQYKAIIEGATMLVCGECANYGTRRWEAEESKTKPKISPKTSLKPKTTSPPITTSQKTLQEELELVEEYPKRIKQAREKLGMTHENLGKKINEKVSLLKKIETGKIKPTQRLAEKLEHVLKVKLLVPVNEPKLPQKALAVAKQKQEITLGDLIKIKGQTEETERKQS